MRHKHFWVPYKTKALGYWEKRKSSGNGIYFKGRAEICGCQMIRFICDDSRLKIVEVDPLLDAFEQDGIVKAKP